MCASAPGGCRDQTRGLAATPLSEGLTTHTAGAPRQRTHTEPNGWPDRLGPPRSLGPLRLPARAGCGGADTCGLPVTYHTMRAIVRAAVAAAITLLASQPVKERSAGGRL